MSKAVRFGSICKEVDVRARARTDLPLLSVTKDRGVCLQSETGRRQLGSPNLSTYKTVTRDQFVMAPMALYYGAIGRLTSVDEGVVSPAYEVFEVDPSVDGAFFEALTRSPALVAKYDALSVGGNRAGKRKTTSFSDFCSISWPIPEPDIQRRIGTTAAAIGRAIAETDHVIVRTVAAKRAVMDGLFTTGLPNRAGVRKPIGQSWPIGRVAGELSEIPEHWELVPLLSVARLESGHTPSRQQPAYWGGEVPWLSLNDTDEIKRLVVGRTRETITALGLQNSSARLLPADSVVLTRTAVRGLASRLGVTMATSQDLVAFVCGPLLDSRYLVQLFRHMQPEWRRLESGTSPTNKTIYFSDFERMKILLPPVEEQQLIADVVLPRTPLDAISRLTAQAA